MLSVEATTLLPPLLYVPFFPILSILSDNVKYSSLSPFFGPPQSSLLGRKGVKIDAQHAALINGIASHVHDYDDTHLDTIIHPTGPVASALLAVAEWKGGFSGKEFLLALIVGIEVECKLGLAVWPEHYDVGWLASIHRFPS